MRRGVCRWRLMMSSFKLENTTNKHLTFLSTLTQADRSVHSDQMPPRAFQAHRRTTLAPRLTTLGDCGLPAPFVHAYSSRRSAGDVQWTPAPRWTVAGRGRHRPQPSGHVDQGPSVSWSAVACLCRLAYRTQVPVPACYCRRAPCSRCLGMPRLGIMRPLDLCQPVPNCAAPLHAAI